MVSGNKNPSDPMKIQPKNREKKTNNYKRANFFSKAWFIWMMPTFWRGFKRDLYDSDLTKPKDNHLSDKLGDRLEKWVKILLIYIKCILTLRAQQKSCTWNILRRTWFFVNMYTYVYAIIKSIYICWPYLHKVVCKNKLCMSQIFKQICLKMIKTVLKCIGILK